MKLLEAAKQVGPEMCGATTALCGMALMSVRLDPAVLLLAHLGPLRCDRMPALVDVPAAEPEMVSYVSEPAMCVADEPAQ